MSVAVVVLATALAGCLDLSRGICNQDLREPFSMGSFEGFLPKLVGDGQWLAWSPDYDADTISAVNCSLTRHESPNEPGLRVAGVVDSTVYASTGHVFGPGRLIAWELGGDSFETKYTFKAPIGTHATGGGHVLVSLIDGPNRTYTLFDATSIEAEPLGFVSAGAKSAVFSSMAYELLVLSDLGLTWGNQSRARSALSFEGFTHRDWDMRQTNIVPPEPASRLAPITGGYISDAKDGLRIVAGNQTTWFACECDLIDVVESLDGFWFLARLSEGGSYSESKVVHVSLPTHEFRIVSTPDRIVQSMVPFNGGVAVLSTNGNTREQATWNVWALHGPPPSL